MESLPPESFRYRVLDSAKRFKNSWIDLGQALYAVYKDKLFKGWGYLTFEAYCAKEIGVRQPTALKLLKSYSFLETEEPAYLKKKSEDQKPSQIPSYEAVNALRLAKASEKLDEDEYEELRQDVLENAKEDVEVKKKIRYILKSGMKAAAAEDPQARKDAAVKRLAAQLEAAKIEMTQADLPPKILKKIDELLGLLADYRP